MIGSNHQPICVPGNATITVLGKISKINNKGSHMLKTAAYANLPSGIVVNCSYDTPKSGRMSVILVNTISRNIWIRQPLLAADIYEVELHPWQYCANLHREGMTLKSIFSWSFHQKLNVISSATRWKQGEDHQTLKSKRTLNQH